MKFCVIVLLIWVCSSCKNKPLFTLIEGNDSGIHFNNVITESDSLNPLTQINIYNGGGVAVADFNNDGLQDIYFTGNMSQNKLYLNKGNWKFEDITDQSGTATKRKWCRGISIVDINNDGREDIYISVTIEDSAKNRRNILYVNQGINGNGIPVFKEMAAEYGLDDTSHTTMAYFFDYDKDGDLDVYLVVNQHIPGDNPSKFRPIIGDGSHPSTDRLYQNTWSDSLQHAVFVNVSKAAGINLEGYGHAAIISDINLDGWKDIYVTNDFLSNNILYINNRDGTFIDSSKQYLKHTSTFAMGVDMQDVNNDGLLDIVELDMNPKDNYRKKMMLGANSYQTFQNFEKYNYQYQYSHNTLQINQGRTISQNDSVDSPIFSETGFLSGIAETDWSWTPLVSDFDNDGNRDVIITNGYPKDVTDHDFMIFRSAAAFIANWEDISNQIPVVKLHNYAFRNVGNLKFEDQTENWGFTLPSFSNGACYADMDNDGDLDIVVNNINDEAFLYRNNSIEYNASSSNYLNITFTGSSHNPDALGAWVEIFYDKGKGQIYEHTPYRGYLSSIQKIAHFGLGKTLNIDSLIVVWPDDKMEVLRNLKSGNTLNLNYENARSKYEWNTLLEAEATLFTEVTIEVGIDLRHQEEDFNDFNIQKLLPRKFSGSAPAIAAADVDGDGLDDLVIGGNGEQPASLLVQQPDGKFRYRPLLDETVTENSINEGYSDRGILLFDADNDGDNDLYIARGGYIKRPESPSYGDRFYVNDGDGNFQLDSTAIPQNFTSTFCVRASDYDKDGDLDLFVSGRVLPWNYPKPVSSFLLRNDSDSNGVKFTNVNDKAAKVLTDIGLVSDALFSDFDNDGWPDLILAGEWMPVTFLKNNKGVFSNISSSSGINDKSGWWNSIAPGDFDNDGDIDYVIGNAGLNSFYKASGEYPLKIVAKDFDNDGNYDAFPFIFLPVSHEDRRLKEFPVNQRDDIIKQMISMRSKFTTYKRYAYASVDSMFTSKELEGSLKLEATTCASVLIENLGSGQFHIQQLPVQAQFSAIKAMVVEDIDQDGNLDIIMSGNDFGTDVSVGRSDAFNGLVLKGDGRGNFIPQTILESGIYIPGEGEALATYANPLGNMMIAASQHNDLLKIFAAKHKRQAYKINAGDALAEIEYDNGKLQKREFYYGSSYLSQSTRTLFFNDRVRTVRIVDNGGNRRKIYPY